MFVGKLPNSEEGGEGKCESGSGGFIVVVGACEMAEDEGEVGPGQWCSYLALWFQTGVCKYRTLDSKVKLVRLNTC